MWVRRSGEHRRAHLFVFCWCVPLVFACLFCHDPQREVPPERSASHQYSRQSSHTPLLISSSVFLRYAAETALA